MPHPVRLSGQASAANQSLPSYAAMASLAMQENTICTLCINKSAGVSRCICCGFRQNLLPLADVSVTHGGFTPGCHSAQQGLTSFFGMGQPMQWKLQVSGVCARLPGSFETSAVLVMKTLRSQQMISDLPDRQASPPNASDSSTGWCHARLSDLIDQKTRTQSMASAMATVRPCNKHVSLCTAIAGPCTSLHPAVMRGWVWHGLWVWFRECHRAHYLLSECLPPFVQLCASCAAGSCSSLDVDGELLLCLIPPASPTPPFCHHGPQRLLCKGGSADLGRAWCAE